MEELRKKSERLLKYFLENKVILEKQTEYTKKIIGNSEKEFYSLARVGEYSYGEVAVVYRDNTKWQAVVVEKIKTSWGEEKMPLFQNHAVSITQNDEGNFISKEEAYYICGIMNIPIVRKYIMNSSDERTFKIRVPIYIPKYIKNNKIHKKISELCLEAHEEFDNLKK